MPDLKKQERIAIILLLSGLILGLSFVAYARYHPQVNIQIAKFKIEQDLAVKITAPVNINDAEPGELMSLKGVGEVLAKRIIEYRNLNGSFRSKDEIKRVKGVGDKLYNNIKDDISTDIQKCQ